MLSFGTDGVRGVANQDLTPELALALGRASARVMGGREVVVGRDPRRSGPMLEAALAAGFAAEGLDVRLLGVVPTPAVAHVAARLGITGAMISASHNPFPDNGIKLFAAGGHKLTDAVEAEIEAEIEARLLGVPDDGPVPTGAEVGTISHDSSPVVHYTDALVGSIDGRRLDGLRVLLDCAHGSGSVIGPAVLRTLGADVVPVHAEPTGLNINEDAGSTSPAALQQLVVEHGADVGLALDGDGDRLLAIDHTGELVDGDHLLAILAIDRRARGALAHDKVVVTVMSNLGFRQAMADHGIDVLDTKVGDRYVLEALRDSGAVLGGEQSGHIIQTDLTTTGDGLLTAITLLDAVIRSGRRLHDLAAEAMQSLPQVLVNVRLATHEPGLIDALAPDIAAVEARLGSRGRILVRASGTEPLIRVMVEAPTAGQARAEADAVADVVRRLAT